MGALEKMCFGPAACSHCLNARADVSVTPATVNRGSSEDSMAAQAWFAADASHSQEKAGPILFRLVEGQTALPSVLRDPALWHAVCRSHWRSRQSESGPQSRSWPSKTEPQGPQGLPWFQRRCDPRSPGQTPRLSQMIYSRQTGMRD
jgi:hypothetical protein